MTIDEVINRMKFEKSYADPMVLDAYDEAIEALEKQIPKKPNYEGDGYYNGELVLDTWICPNCEKRYEVDYDNYDYCPNCGQHIDHSTFTEDEIQIKEGVISEH